MSGAPDDAETVIMPMVRVDLAERARPARQFLGVTAKQPDPVLADGWTWVAWRSEGRAWRTKLGDRPAGFLAQELYSVRLAGPWSDQVPAQRWRAVVLWSRPLVHLDKAKISKRTGRRPVAAASWSSDAWIWRAGRAGSVPRECLVGDAQHMATTGRPSPEVWAGLAGPWLEDNARAELVAALGARWIKDDENETEGGS